MWNLTKCWRRLKESLWFPLVEQEVSFLPPPVWSHLCMSLCVVTPHPPSPLQKHPGPRSERSHLFICRLHKGTYLNYVNKDWKPSLVVLQLRTPTHTYTHTCALTSLSAVQLWRWDTIMDAAVGSIFICCCIRQVSLCSCKKKHIFTSVAQNVKFSG